ncbi:MAG TPA: MBL fold metallo-hydrolase [Streptosporangiaceae bacterium]|nr:MBL fold metallo-hydrolase [Streptosporangiaceae bacterium]
MTAPVDFSSGAPVAGDLDVRWIHGAAGEPPIQVHAYDPHTYVLRQSKASNYEAPFLYLLFGNERALLMDTGATREAATFPLRETVDGLLDGWLAEHPREDYELVVAHTHAHGDHIAGDGQFDGRPLTTVVPHEPAAVAAFFGFSSWPDEVVRFDLGGRVLDVTGIPGHQPASIAVFDPWSGFLLTGDTVYPGRLYALDFPSFTASLDRLAEFAAARPVTHVMGCHIEMTRKPGRDYPLGSKYQPDEPPLQMTVAQLAGVRDAARAAASKSGVHNAGDVIIFHGPCKAAVVRQLARATARRLTGRDSP